MIKITDPDILRIESKFKLHFDDESKEFIKCLESKDIQACPGAGKTTSLVTKLDIFSDSMPFNDNSGILVLTHTNVAVDEIRRKLGTNANKLLNYPNHVGTFQSFINKYLAIPMYVKLLKKKPVRIDSQIFNDKLLKKLKKYYLDKFIKMSSEANKYTNIEYYLEALEVEDSRVVLLQKNGTKKTIVNKGKPSYRNLKRALDNNVINEVIIDGYLTYEHCYDLSLKYLESYKKISRVFQKRFKYVFIDEAQDTADKQFLIINKLFNNSDVVIQRIGDNNQAIFNFLGEKEKGWEIEGGFIEIKDTKRMSKKIADISARVAQNPQVLNGNGEIKIKPIVILFDDSNIEKVIPTFANLIIKYNLYVEKNPLFKAIGGIAKRNDNGHTLVDYFSSYKKTDNIQEHDDLVNKLQEYSDRLYPKNYRDIALDIVKEYLMVKNIKIEGKHFTKTTLLNHLKETDNKSYNDFKLILLRIATKLNSKKCIKSNLEKLLVVILEVLEEPPIDSTTLSDIEKNYKIDFDKNKNSNVYHHNVKNISFDISISTIHAVKGETHTATLVLETFKDGYDVHQLLELLKGNTIKNNSQTFQNKKKLIYVAMTRATHFLCLAMHRQHVHRNKVKNITSDDIKHLIDNGINVIGIKN
jgi:DNA helicase II / ATP-dependent DNA helicase PcrA